ncbi:hypothetical protein BJ878DRAFT_420220 [Calycina marina]|uniref:RRM domain-containing protein n=1 Tax=Calycina marina TaxID=1763456 RepID=A0A9P7Z3L4_9HELO|nr:hypothetical protein BJ878DRAFT_420220 [Calycina marina]
MNSQAFPSSGQAYRANGNGNQTQQYSSLSIKISNTAAGDNGPDTPQSYTPVAMPSLPTAVLIRLLPINTTPEALRLMVVWSQEYIDAEIQAGEKSDDPGFRSAVLRFKTHRGAMEAKNMLDGKPNGEAKMIVTFFPGRLTFSRRSTVDHTADAVPSTSNSSSTASSNGPPNRQSSRFNGSFQSTQRVSPPSNGVYASNELPNPGNSARYQTLFSPQSPIGNHLNERTRVTGKSLINNDNGDEDDTGELLKDPVAYAEYSSGQARRATIPELPISRFDGMSLNTSNAPVPMSAQVSNMTPQCQPSYAHQMSPAAMSPSNGGPPVNYQLNSQHYQRPTYPPVNPADQNPPCNTLYVGNLPIDTSEDELKAMFSKQRGYKRLCFRTKQNGPMCFVEFEDVSFATKALHELYGHPLHNSIKGGIRLSFSKNPLGVRSGQGLLPQSSSNMPGLIQSMNGMMMGDPGSFSSANGPPPGLTAPPGLGPSRIGCAQNSMSSMNGGAHGHYGPPYAQNGWNQQFSNPMATGGHGNMMNNNNQGFPSYMIGR